MKSKEQDPLYNLVVLLENISALYAIDFGLHSPSSGQAVFILQLHFGSAVGGLSGFGKAERSFLLWRTKTADIFGIQLYSEPSFIAGDTFQK